MEYPHSIIYYCQKQLKNDWKNVLSRPFQQKNGKDKLTVSTRKGSTDSIQFNGKFKTELCKYWTQNSECPFQTLCSFAHGYDQLRSKQSLPNKYKTRPCLKFTLQGFCPYGIRCQFVHQQTKPTSTYQQIIEIIKNDSIFFFEMRAMKVNVRPHRLSYFVQLCQNQQQNSIVKQNQRTDAFFQNKLDIPTIRCRYNSI